MQYEILTRNALRVLRSGLLRKSIASALIKAVFVLLGLLTTVVLARLLGPAGLGHYTLALTILTFIALPAKAGMPQVVVRETARSIASGRLDLVKGLWRWAGFYVAMFTVLLTAFTFAILLAGRGRWDPSLVSAITVGLVLIPLFAAGELRSACLRGLGRVIAGQLPDLIVRPAVMLLLLASAYFFGRELDPGSAIGVYALASGVSFIVGTGLLLRISPPLHEVSATSNTAEWSRSTIPMAVTNIFFLANSQIDILLIGYFLEPEDIGVYRVAIQGSLLVVFGLQATKMVVEPAFARLIAVGNAAELQILATRISRFNGLLAIVVLLVLAAFAKRAIPTVFGPEFAGAALPLMILCAARLSGAVVGSSGHLLNMAGLERVYARIWVLSSILALVLNFLFIPRFGISGAATATGIGLVAANLASWYLAKRKLNCDCSPFGSWRA